MFIEIDSIEQILEKLRTILQDIDEIGTYIITNDKQEIYLKATKIKDNANDINEIFKNVKIEK